MTDAEIALLAASVAFVGTHFALSHRLRAPLVRAAGETGFAALYSLVALATLGWMILAFRATDADALVLPWGHGDAEWIAASALTFLALALIVAASTPNNPAMGLPGANGVARAEPVGALRLTRHPMMWGFALWALAHVVAAPTLRTLIVAGAIAVLALGGAAAQDAKKRRLMGAAWAGWEARTNFVPRPSRIGSIPLAAWAIAATLWLVATWAHAPLGGMDAGVWRWFG